MVRRELGASRRAAAIAVLTVSCLPAQSRDLVRCVLESPGGDLPFLMTLILGRYKIHHGDHSLSVRGTPSPAGDVVELPPYDSRFVFSTGRPGVWTKVGPQGEVTMPMRFEACELVSAAGGERLTQKPLFAIAGEPWDATGRWAVQFARDAEPAIAIIEANRGEWSKQPGEIQGTFLTVTGDYRYLAGTARGDTLALACFDGAHAFLFEARRQADGSLRGDFWSGASWHETWTASRSDTAALPDAFTLTQARPDVQLGALQFEDLADGKGASRRVGELFGKVTVVTLFGTWCPNCNDAGQLLAELHERHAARGLRLVGLAFEHGEDRARHRRVVAAYRELHRVSWPILLAGSSDKKKASAAVPAVDQVRAFPTFLFVDGSGVVRAIYQGFAGPATGAGHRRQRESFEQVVVRLLDEAEAAARK